jgi:hypothetical protein
VSRMSRLYSHSPEPRTIRKCGGGDYHPLIMTMMTMMMMMVTMMMVVMMMMMMMMTNHTNQGFQDLAWLDHLMTTMTTNDTQSGDDDDDPTASVVLGTQRIWPQSSSQNEEVRRRNMVE